MFDGKQKQNFPMQLTFHYLLLKPGLSNTCWQLTQLINMFLNHHIDLFNTLIKHQKDAADPEKKFSISNFSKAT